MRYLAYARRSLHALGAPQPKMNQFIVGKRLYQRKGIWISFSMKRKRLNKEAKLSAVKLPGQSGETFRQLCERINGRST